MRRIIHFFNVQLSERRFFIEYLMLTMALGASYPLFASFFVDGVLDKLILYLGTGLFIGFMYYKLSDIGEFRTRPNMLFAICFPYLVYDSCKLLYYCPMPACVLIVVSTVLVSGLFGYILMKHSPIGSKHSKVLRFAIVSQGIACVLLCICILSMRTIRYYRTSMMLTTV